jgi:putative protease
MYEDEKEKIDRILKEAKEAGVDSIILWDLGILQLAKKNGFSITLSTQASISNSLSANFFRDLGVNKVVLARECTLEQIKQIKENTGMEIEVFVHGAMCMAISGRCFLSEYMYGNSANRGKCLQPCRREYIIIDPETKKELKIGNNYIMSPKDLNTIPIIDMILDTGVDSLKIEGRGRSPEYVYTTTKAYRTAIDAYHSGRLTKNLKENLIKDLKKVYNKGFSTGFYLGVPLNEWANSYGSKATQRKTYIGDIGKFYKKINVAEIKVKANSFKVGDKIMIQGKTTGVRELTAKSIQFNHKNIEVAEKGKNVALMLGFEARPKDKVFKITEIK